MEIYLLVSALAFLFCIWLVEQLHKEEVKKILSEGGIKFEDVFIKVNRFTESLKIAGITTLMGGFFLLAVLSISLSSDLNYSDLVFIIGFIFIFLLLIFLSSFLLNYFMHVAWGLSFNYDFTLGGPAEIANLKTCLLLGRNGIWGVFRCPYKNIISINRTSELILQLKFKKRPYFLYKLFHTDRVALQFKSSGDANNFEKNIREFNQKFI